MKKQIKITKRLKNKYIYVDIDGTLAEYRFNDHVSAKDGTTNGQTREEICNHIFLRSRPLKSVIETLKRAKAKRLCICGAVISPIEVIDKLNWLKLNCKDLKFSNYYWFVPNEYWDDFASLLKNESNIVDSSSEDDSIYTQYGTFFRGSKTMIWDWVVKHNTHKLGEAVFIDDVLAYLKYAEEKGVTAYHISSFMA